MEYFVTGNLNHDCKEYKRGDVIDLDPAGVVQARLHAAGVIQTEPIANTQAARAPAPEATSQPEVAGKPMETGEPSIDGREGERTGDNARDITPGMDTGMRALSPDVRAGADMAPVKGSEAAPEPSEDMKRDELEAMALTEGIDAKTVEDAPNKGALIDLILARRQKALELNGEPEHDPSANL